MSRRVFPGIPARSSRMRFGSLPCPHPAPLQSPCTILSLLPGRQQCGGWCCFPWEELLPQVAQSASQDSENSLGMWMPNFAYISRVQFSDSVQQLSAENQDSSQSIKTYIQKLKLSSVHYTTCISWLGFQQKSNNHHWCTGLKCPFI